MQQEEVLEILDLKIKFTVNHHLLLRRVRIELVVAVRD